MDWIKLHKYGRDVFLDYPNRIVIESRCVEGKEITMIHAVDGFVFDEATEQFLAMIQKPESDTELRDAVKELMRILNKVRIDIPLVCSPGEWDIIKKQYRESRNKVEKLLGMP